MYGLIASLRSRVLKFVHNECCIATDRID